MRHALIPDADGVAELVATRRDLHRHPELKYEEHRTAGVVATRLRALGLDPVEGVGKTGVVAVQEAEVSGPCVLLRADMDALPMQELGEVPYRSTHDGVMHACGHDGHTSIALGAARLLQGSGAPANGTIKYMFQPAEEGGNGADAMIEDGVLEAPKVDAAFGLHLWNHLEVGKVAIVDGPFMAAVDAFTIEVRGEGGHGAMPHETRDPVLAAAHIVVALQQIVARNVHPLEAAVVTVGKITSGDAFNIIPEVAHLEGTLRSFSDEVWTALPGHVKRVVEHTAKAHGCTATIQIDRKMRPTINDPAMAELVREVAREVVGPDNIVALQTMGGEDFASILAAVPGCYFFVGSRNEAKGKIHPHHSPYFDIDEDALPVGVQMLTGVARRFLRASS